MGFWENKTVLVTGHTGFKGSWLVLWLSSLGARVHGVALEPPTEPNHYAVADIHSLMTSDRRVDIRDVESLNKVFAEHLPDIVFHLAAQSLVRTSYQETVYTYSVNTLGTVHILEAIRHTPAVRVAVMVTTDKVYRNHEWPYPYRENDTLGGSDPYSASKACAELVIDSYRQSFFIGRNTSISSVRSGNVIGGGDWSLDRLVPDAVRAFTTGRPLLLRKPHCIRPWQHVLEPLSGYLTLAEAQWNEPDTHAREWNFAPPADNVMTVGQVAERVAHLWGDGASIKYAPQPDDPPEADILLLDASLARYVLGWGPKWSLNRSLEKTVDWYRNCIKKQNIQKYSLSQITAYMESEKL